MCKRMCVHVWAHAPRSRPPHVIMPSNYRPWDHRLWLAGRRLGGHVAPTEVLHRGDLRGAARPQDHLQERGRLSLRRWVLALRGLVRRRRWNRLRMGPAPPDQSPKFDRPETLDPKLPKADTQKLDLYPKTYTLLGGRNSIGARKQQTILTLALILKPLQYPPPPIIIACKSKISLYRVGGGF